jgi:hemolysin D
MRSPDRGARAVTGDRPGGGASLGPRPPRARPLRRRRDEREFLPAALEIEETPPSPAGRLLLWTIVTLLALAVAWAYVGEIDVVAIAPGKLVPSGRVKVIQPLEAGVIRTIQVGEGQAVEAGAVLVELDPTAADADEARLTKELSAARLALARLTLLTSALEQLAPFGDTALAPGRTAGGSLPADGPPGASGGSPPDPEPSRSEVRARASGTTPLAAARAPWPRWDESDVSVPEVLGGPVALSPVQRRILEGQLAEIRARLATLEHAFTEREAAYLAARETVAKLERTLPLVSQRVEALKALADRQMGATAEYLALEQERIAQAQDLKIQQARVKELEAAIARAREERAGVEAEYTRARYEERAEAERRLEALVEELAKAQRRARLQTLTAPVAGIVQQLAVHTAGGIVTPAQVLMHIVPRGDLLEVEARLPNKDIGFVTEGQRAEVKLETFPFTRYGTIRAEVTAVSSDAVTDPQAGLVYPVRARLARTVMGVDGREMPLSPGMAVTLEVKTGTRRVIEFVLSPLLKGLGESGRER